MKEIEVKAKLKDRQRVTDKLTALGCVFSQPVTQQDTVYAKKLGSLEVFKASHLFLRIRIIDNKKILLTLKQPQSNGLDKLEHEIEISSAEEMEKMLTLMGYQKGVVVIKTRTTTHLNNNEICIDEVKGLGTFIEIEKLTEQGNADKIQDELFAFLISLGVAPVDRVTIGYDLLMIQKLEARE